MKKTISIAFGFFFLLACLLSAVGASVFDHGFYTDLYEEIDLEESTGVDIDQLHDAIFLMTDYVEGKRDDLDGQTFYQGRWQETFNAKEKKHMVDVRALWQNAKKVMTICWICAAVCFGCLLYKDGFQAFGELFSGLKRALAVFAFFLAFFGFWCLIDFTGFWTWFHTVFFAGNNDWLLDPRVDFMIVICPEVMFSSLIAKCAAILLEALGVCSLAFWYLRKSVRMMAGMPGLSLKQKQEALFERSGR